MFIEENIVYGVNYAGKKALFEKAEEILSANNSVKEGYAEALYKRESEYPTGLELGLINIALCHTDNDWVLKNDSMIFKLDESIVFESMETQEEIEVDHVFVLALKDADSHLTMLQALSTAFQDEVWLQKIKDSKNKQELLNVINSIF